MTDTAAAVKRLEEWLKVPAGGFVKHDADVSTVISALRQALAHVRTLTASVAEQRALIERQAAQLLTMGGELEAAREECERLTLAVKPFHDAWMEFEECTDSDTTQPMMPGMSDFAEAANAYIEAKNPGVHPFRKALTPPTGEAK